jgi:flagellar FliJ protein
MKKFEFSLKKLLNYKEQLLKKEKNILADLRKQLLLLNEEKNDLIRQRRIKNEELNKKILKGLSPQHIALHKSYIDSITEKIANINLNIANLENRIQQQLEVVVEITKEIDSYEKLEQKQFEEYKKVETKQNELFIEEFVSHKSFVAH